MADSNSKTGATRAQLPGPQKFQLCTWVAGNAPRLSGKTAQAIAKTAAEELAFAVTPSNISGARRATGAKFKIAGEPTGKSHKKIGDQHDRDRTSFVAAELMRLMERIGDPVPVRLRAIATRCAA